MDERAKKLLDAHVAHELSRLQGEGLERFIEARVQALWAWFEELPFGEAVRLDDVVGLAERYALELRVSGGISELAGEIARVVLNSSINAEVRVGDIVASESFEEFSEKIAGLDGVRAEIIALVARSEALSVVSARVLTHIVTDLLRRVGQRTALGPLAPLMARIEHGLLPQFERRASLLLGQRFADSQSPFVAEVERHVRDVIDGQALLEIGEELWLHLSRKRLSDTFAFLGEQDLEDFVILCFEFWLRFRKTPYMRHVLREAIGFFFGKYAEESVAAVISDMGVTREMVANELKLFLVPLAERAIEDGFLEAQLRTVLCDFYDSDGYRKALG